MSTEAVQFAVALADVGNRFVAAQRLAAYAGAEALLILVEDQAVDALVPLITFPTVAGGKGWRDLRAAARRPGLHTGVVAYPTAQTSTTALAYAHSGIVLVFIGGCAKRGVIEELAMVMPLLAACFLAEHAAVVALGEKRVALTNAREAQALALALDAARSELERTLRALEERSRALDDARARAEQAVRAKDEFLAMLGHELRNPLSPMMTAVQLLRLKGLAGKEHDIIERQVINLTRLVDDLLDVSRLTAGKIALRKEVVEIADAATRAIEMVSPLLEQKRQALKVNIPPRGLLVDADPSRLSQILANLLANAAKYSDEETSITFDALKEDGSVRIRVSDQGIGISPEMLDKIFDLFEQQHQSIDRSQGGLGLGLAIARSLVTLHGGTIRAASAGPGRGSVFSVELPPAEGRPQAADPRPEQKVVHANGRGKRVLVVDDNNDALMLLAEVLRRLDFVVQIAHDGPTAIEVARRFPPQAAVLDIGLPVMDGYELAERLRALDGCEGIKLIAVTGYGQETDRRRSAKAGFDAHLIKPVLLADLQRILTEPGPQHNVTTT